MSIIDDYITKNRDFLSDAEMSRELGLSAHWIAHRRTIINRFVPPKSTTITLSDEAVALIHLIEVRKTGWAVDVAKERLNDLAKVINKS